MDSVPSYPDNWLPNLTKYLSSRFLGHIAYQIQSVAVGWQVYELTGNPMDLGIVGLVQFLPIFLFSLPAGHVADSMSRKVLSVIGIAVCLVCSLLLLAISTMANPNVYWIYCVLFIFSTMRAFSGPANQSLLADLVPKREFSRVVAWNSSLWQIGVTVGPMIGGLVYGAFGNAKGPYIAVAICFLMGLVIQIQVKAQNTLKRTPPSLETLLAGLKYVFHKKNILGAISLDLFAVLFGGAVALLPAIAKDILHTGPMGLGILRSAPGVGAALTALYFSYRPIQRNAGLKMFSCVAIFGLATIGFGLSTSLWFSFICLFITGAVDMVSVLVRGTLVQLETPTEMRGRVSAVNLIFISASNELGEFESGLTASWFGLIPSIIIGGIGTVIVAGVWAYLFPSLRKLDRLSD